MLLYVLVKKMQLKTLLQQLKMMNQLLQLIMYHSKQYGHNLKTKEMKIIVIPTFSPKILKSKQLKKNLKLPLNILVKYFHSNYKNQLLLSILSQQQLPKKLNLHLLTMLQKNLLVKQLLYLLQILILKLCLMKEKFISPLSKAKKLDNNS